MYIAKDADPKKQGPRSWLINLLQCLGGKFYKLYLRTTLFKTL